MFVHATGENRMSVSSVPFLVSALSGQQKFDPATPAGTWAVVGLDRARIGVPLIFGGDGTFHSMPRGSGVTSPDYGRTTSGGAMKASRIQTIILLFIFFSLSACNTYGQQPPGASPKITVATVQQKAVTVTQQYVAQIQSLQHIEVRAPAEGYLAATAIREGQTVKQGDLILQIESVLYKARLDAEQAERDAARLELNSAKELVDKGGSQLDLKLHEAKLAKAQAKVGLASAELNFTNVRAPFDGIAGRLPRQKGTFVLKGEVLTTLSDNSMMRVYFNVPENRYLEYMTAAGRKQQAPDVELVLADHSKFPHTGKLAAIDTDFNRETGTIAFRADFPNPERLLRHGQTGTLLINQALSDAIVVPQRSTLEASNKRYVYVVDKAGVAHRREVVIRYELDDQFVVKTGVGAGDKIVVEGVRLVHDGDKVEN